MHFTKRDISCAVLLIIIAVVMFLLNFFTPLFCDDWHYVFSFGTQTRIQSIQDVIVSQWHHYFGFNGRFVVHCFVQLFDGILGKGVFNVINALMFALLLCAMARLAVRKRYEYYYPVISLAFILLFFLIPGFKYEFLWLSGSCNYLWVAVALSFFIYLLEADDERFPSWSPLPLLLFGVVCGWSNEAFVIGLAAAYFVYYCKHRKTIGRPKKLLLLGFFIGVVLLTISPGSLRRAVSANGGDFAFGMRLRSLFDVRLFYVLAALVIAKSMLRRLRFKEWLKREYVLVIAIFVTFAFVLMTGSHFPQTKFGIEFFSLILILRNIDWARVNRLWVTLANVATLACACYVLFVCSKCYAANQKELSMVTHSHCIVPTVQPYGYNSFAHRFALDYAGNFRHDGQKPFGGHPWLSQYFGYKDVWFMPQNFLDDLKVHHDLYDEFHTFGELPFYAKRLPNPQSVAYAEIHFRQSKYDGLFWPLNQICNTLTGYDGFDVADAYVVNINGEYYVLVDRYDISQDKRVSAIQLKDKIR